MHDRMRLVYNVHERSLATLGAGAARLLDALASPNDALWPSDQWTAMRLDQHLADGATGGHGPIRYRVERYVPGELVRFRFVAPRGLLGTHTFEVLDDAVGVRLRHVVDMRLAGWARLSWPFVYRPLHDALLEGALDGAARAVGAGAPPPAGDSSR